MPECVSECTRVCVCQSVCMYLNVVKSTRQLIDKTHKKTKGNKAERGKEREREREGEGKREQEKEAALSAGCRDSSLHATTRASHAWHAPSQAYLAANYGQHIAHTTR